MTRPRKLIESALEKKGFEKAEGDHHYFYLLDADGRRTSIWTKTSHSPKHKDLGDALLAAMAKQVALNKTEFPQLVDCTLSEEGYRKKLRQQGKNC